MIQHAARSQKRLRITPIVLVALGVSLGVAQAIVQPSGYEARRTVYVTASYLDDNLDKAGEKYTAHYYANRVANESDFRHATALVRTANTAEISVFAYATESHDAKSLADSAAQILEARVNDGNLAGDSVLLVAARDGGSPSVDLSGSAAWRHGVLLALLGTSVGTYAWLIWRPTDTNMKDESL